MKLNRIISDGIVFRRNKPIYVTGEGKGTVTVSFLREEKSVTADGKFAVKLSARPEGGPYEMNINLDGEEITLHDVMVGEVITVAGQSNAELTVWETLDRDTVFPSDDKIRFYMESQIAVGENGEPITADSDSTGKWVYLTEENAKFRTAIGLHCARYYREKYGCAVGVMCCYKGATVIESFLPEEILSKYSPDKEKLMEDHVLPFFAWNKPSFLYENLLLPIIPLQTGAVIWYQGESNRTVYEGENFYEDWLCELVSMWRKLLDDSDIPFIVIQINNFPEVSEDGITAIQKAQERAVEKIDRCELVKIADMGWWGNIHPQNKREVSERVCKALDTLRQ